MIQYSEALEMESKTRGVLDTPHARGMTAVREARSHTPTLMPAFRPWFMNCKTVRSILIVFGELFSTPRRFLEARDQPLTLFFGTV